MMKQALFVAILIVLALPGLAQNGVPVRPAPRDTMPPSVETGLIDVGTLDKPKRMEAKKAIKKEQKAEKKEAKAEKKEAKRVEKKQEKAEKTQEKASRQLQKKTKPLSAAEPMPEPGYDVDAFIAQNLKYPQADPAAKGGKVFVQYLVQEDGRVTDVKVLRGLSTPFDTEAIRVVQLLPAYQAPAKKDGKAVPVRVVKPVRFKM